jgi:protein TonB
MFKNLVESTTHAAENKRRASFMLGTTALYGVLLTGGAIASVYAYDAHLENQNLQLVSIVIPTTQPEKPQPPQPRPASQPRVSEDREAPTVTEINTMRTDIAPPTKITAVATNVAPPDMGKMRIGLVNKISTSRGVVFNNEGVEGPDTGNIEKPLPPPVEKPKTQPTPEPKVEPTPKPAPKPPAIISGGVVNGKAKYLPPPKYPAIAITAGASGIVQVQVTIDEDGKVISARAVSGHPLLRAEAERAAFNARFTPTYLTNQPVKVSGVINYNFVRQ